MASRSVRGAAAVPGRSSVEARAGPELRIIDLYRGHVDPFSLADLALRVHLEPVHWVLQ